MSTASSVVVQLLAAAPARLRAWMDAPQPLSVRGETRAEVRVMGVVERAAQRQKLIEQVVDRLAQEWLSDRGGAGSVDWSQVTESDTETVVDDIWDAARERLARNYRIDKDALRTFLRGWVAKQQAVELVGVNIWTDAPKDYDHGYARRTKDTFVNAYGKTIQRVVVPSEDQAAFQSRRYESGMHAAYDDKRAEEERQYAAKRARLDTFTQAVKDVQALLARGELLVPARRAQSGGYWEIGHPDKFVYDEKTGRTIRHSVTLAEVAERPDPDEAVKVLLAARAQFAALPSDVRRDQFRTEHDIDEVLKLANREVQRLFQEKQKRDKVAAENNADLMKAQRAFVAEAEKLGVPGNKSVLVASETTYGRSWSPDKVIGRITAWPPVAGVVQTERGPRAIDAVSPAGEKGGRTRLTVLPGPPEYVPPAVWDNLTGANVTVVNTKKGIVYAQKPASAYGTLVVLREDGSKVPKGSAAYEEAVGVVTGYASQDSAIDQALGAYKADYPGRQGWGPVVDVKSGDVVVKVRFHPPVGAHGWRVATAEMSTAQGKRGYLLWERLKKRDPVAKVFWKTIMVRGEAIIAPHELDEAFAT